MLYLVDCVFYLVCFLSIFVCLLPCWRNRPYDDVDDDDDRLRKTLRHRDKPAVFKWS